jgi:hypothetical protein
MVVPFQLFDNACIPITVCRHGAQTQGAVTS